MYAEEVKENMRLVEEEETSHIEIKIIHHDKFFEHLHMKRTVIDDKIPFPVSTLETYY